MKLVYRMVRLSGSEEDMTDDLRSLRRAFEKDWADDFDLGGIESQVVHMTATDRSVVCILAIDAREEE